MIRSTSMSPCRHVLDESASVPSSNFRACGLAAGILGQRFGRRRIHAKAAADVVAVDSQRSVERQCSPNLGRLLRQLHRSRRRAAVSRGWFHRQSAHYDYALASRDARALGRTGGSSSARFAPRFSSLIRRPRVLRASCRSRDLQGQQRTLRTVAAPSIEAATALLTCAASCAAARSSAPARPAPSPPADAASRSC